MCWRVSITCSRHTDTGSKSSLPNETPALDKHVHTPPDITRTSHMWTDMNMVRRKTLRAFQDCNPIWQQLQGCHFLSYAGPHCSQAQPGLLGKLPPHTCHCKDIRDAYSVFWWMAVLVRSMKLCVNEAVPRCVCAPFLLHLGAHP